MPVEKVSVSSFASLSQLNPDFPGVPFSNGFEKGAVPTAVGGSLEPNDGRDEAADTHGGALYG